MKLIIKDDYDELSVHAAGIIADTLRENPDTVLGLATGSTPLGTYKELIRLHKEDGLDFSQVTTFNLDEYLGLTPDHPQSYHHFMFSTLFDHINIDPKNVHIPDGTEEDEGDYCPRYERAIAEAGGIDLQILGIGQNGHIGFNEPSEELPLDTHFADLSRSTIDANSRFFSSKDEVPTRAITLGIRGVMRAKKILLLASGYEKAYIISRLVNRQVVTPYNPSSLIHLHHDATVIMDREAASKLR